jgi:hypothetical protein
MPCVAQRAPTSYVGNRLAYFATSEVGRETPDETENGSYNNSVPKSRAAGPQRSHFRVIVQFRGFCRDVFLKQDAAQLLLRFAGAVSLERRQQLATRCGGSSFTEERKAPSKFLQRWL